MNSLKLFALFAWVRSFSGCHFTVSARAIQGTKQRYEGDRDKQ
jgi:hypothetical protein